MSLTSLIRKGGLAKSVTMTPATTATQTTDQKTTVAPVATVAVAMPYTPPPEFSLNDEEKIRAWFAYIEETDQTTVKEMLDMCRDNLDTRRQFLKWSNELLDTDSIIQQVTCNDCRHFKRINYSHLGHCEKGEPEAIAGLWGTDRRSCDQYQTGEKSKSNNDD